MLISTARTPRPTDPVARVMMWPVATTFTDTSLWEVAEALAADEVGVLGVLENGDLVGVVSERDVVRHLAERANPDHVTAGDIMSTDLVTVGPSESVLDAASRMREADVRHLPVLDAGLIAGLVSSRDVLDVLVEAVAS